MSMSSVLCFNFCILSRIMGRSSKKVSVEEEQKNIKQGVKFFNPEDVSENLCCSICGDIFTDPFCLHCGHTFCKGCVSQWLSQKKSCPTCRNTIDQRFCHRDLLALRFIESLDVFCCNSGCTWIGPYCELTSHVRDCSLSPETFPAWLTDLCAVTDALTESSAGTDRTPNQSVRTSLPGKRSEYKANGGEEMSLLMRNASKKARSEASSVTGVLPGISVGDENSEPALNTGAVQPETHGVIMRAILQTIGILSPPRPVPEPVDVHDLT